MVLTQARYFLRLESGARVGETIPIPASGLKVGRRPDNDLHIAEASVSGRHAELQVDEHGVTLRDLGSTNGTRVGADKITERRLVHGDDVVFGHVQASFVDRELVGDAAPAAVVPSEAGGAGEAVRTVGTERVASTGKRGLPGLLLLVAGVAAAGGAAWWFLLRPAAEEQGGAARTPVVAVAGNQLPDASFEGGAETWEIADGAPAGFSRGVAFRRSGDLGLGADLLGGEWARASSPGVKARDRRALELSAALDVAGDAEACVGIELSASAGDRASFVAWGATLRDTDGFAVASLVAPSLPGYDQARVVVEARCTGTEESASGTAALDDVALVEVAAPPPAATFEDHAFHLLGQPAHTGALVHVTQVVLAGLRLRAGDAGGGPRWSAGTLSASATGNGMRLGFSGADRDAALAFTANLEEPRFVATTGPDGFRAYGGGLEDVRATSLLLGGGTRLLRLGFAEEVSISATTGAGGLRVEISLGALEDADLQLSFREERVEADNLAAAAREATRKDAGAGLAAWSRLLNDYPFQTRLVEEAERERARLLRAGHQELNALRDDFERARFFGLADLYQRSWNAARALAARYAGSEVADAAQELAADIDAERAELERSRSAFERERLQAVLDVIERRKWTSLAERVRDALDG